MSHFDDRGDLWITIEGGMPPEMILRDGVSAIFEGPAVPNLGGICPLLIRLNLTQYVRLLAAEQVA